MQFRRMFIGKKGNRSARTKKENTMHALYKQNRTKDSNYVSILSHKKETKYVKCISSFFLHNRARKATNVRCYTKNLINMSPIVLNTIIDEVSSRFLLDRFPAAPYSRALFTRKQINRERNKRKIMELSQYQRSVYKRPVGPIEKANRANHHCTVLYRNIKTTVGQKMSDELKKDSRNRRMKTKTNTG